MGFSFFKSSTPLPKNDSSESKPILSRVSTSSTLIDDKQSHITPPRPSSSDSATNSTAPAPANIPGTVPLCPHESLTAARLALIYGLSAFKPAKYPGDPIEKVDALTLSSKHHVRFEHSPYPLVFKHACKPLIQHPRDSDGRTESRMMALTGTAEFAYRFRPLGMTDDTWHRRTTDIPYLTVYTTWAVLFPQRQDPPQTIEQFRGAVERAEVKLCPHKELSDPEISFAVYDAVNPYNQPWDPLDKYQQMNEGYGCKDCGAHITICLSKPGITSGWAWKVDVCTTRALGQPSGSQWTKSCTA